MGGGTDPPRQPGMTLSDSTARKRHRLVERSALTLPVGRRTMRLRKGEGDETIHDLATLRDRSADYPGWERQHCNGRRERSTNHGPGWGNHASRSEDPWACLAVRSLQLAMVDRMTGPWPHPPSGVRGLGPAPTRLRASRTLYNTWPNMSFDSATSSTSTRSWLQTWSFGSSAWSPKTNEP
jgi:hypothetical protein